MGNLGLRRGLGSVAVCVVVMGVVAGAPLSASAAGGASTQGAYVSGNPLFSVISSSNQFTTVGVTQHNINGTSSAQTATFSPQASGTVSVTASATIEGGIGAALASIKASVTASATSSLTVSVGNSTTLTVPAQKTGYAAYGAKTTSVYGQSYRQTANCVAYNVRKATVVAPTSVGWKTWIG